MRYLIIVNTKDVETVWNTLRLACTALIRGHKVNIFLLGAGVEIDSINDKNFDIRKLWERFLELGGEALSCGTCLRIRNKNSSELCPISSMDDLVTLSEEADKVMVFS
ncbi:hypothetical protein HRbin06_00470 [archaeon HR06]|nr:hypothetical protein HRbin06_00470 [archaeon HR06]